MAATAAVYDEYGLLPFIGGMRNEHSQVVGSQLSHGLVLAVQSQHVPVESGPNINRAMTYFAARAASFFLDLTVYDTPKTDSLTVPGLPGPSSPPSPSSQESYTHPIRRWN